MGTMFHTFPVYHPSLDIAEKTFHTFPAYHPSLDIKKPPAGGFLSKHVTTDSLLPHSVRKHQCRARRCRRLPTVVAANRLVVASD